MPEIAPGMTGTPSQLSTTGMSAGISGCADSGVEVGGSGVAVAGIGVSVGGSGVGAGAAGVQALINNAMQIDAMMVCFNVFPSSVMCFLIKVVGYYPTL